MRVTAGADLKPGGTVTDVADCGLSAGEDAEGSENEDAVVLAFDEFLECGTREGEERE